MKTLALTTSGTICGLALFDDDRLIADPSFPHEMRLLERLTPLIASMLESGGLTPHSIDLYAVDIGPGSFTGVRIGVMTAKTLAWATGRDIAPVSSLEAVALGADQSATHVLAAIRARPGWAYWQLFGTEEGGLNALTPPAMSDANEVGTGLIGMDVRDCALRSCDMTDEVHSAIASSLRSVEIAVTLEERGTVRAEHIAQRAAWRRRHGARYSAEDVTPLYVAAPAIGAPAKTT